MLKAKIYDLALFENFLGIINKFVQQCEFVLDTNNLNVYCKNPTAFTSARLLLNTDVIKLNVGQKYQDVRICVRDVVAFKSAISIVQQIENINEIEIGLNEIENEDGTIYIKNIKYKGKNGANFNLITIDFDVIKDFISKDTTTKLVQNWKFNINPKNLDIAQNKTNNIVNINEVGIYIYPESKDGRAVISLASKASAAINSISIPISESSEGSLENFFEPAVCIHESSFRIFNILRVTNSNDIECFFNFDNNVFFITSHLKSESNYSINSRLFVQMVKGK
jgi:hypothetical protein